MVKKPLRIQLKGKNMVKTVFNLELALVVPLLLAICVGAQGVSQAGVETVASPAPNQVAAIHSVALARDGATEYAIVRPANPSPAEQTAANELATYLNKVTGAEFRIVDERATERPAKAIYLGWTAFAAAQGIDCARFGAEEWLLRTRGDDLVITGGRPRGTLYGVYDFLENQVGVHWLDRDTEVVPKRPTLSVGALDRRAMPAFRLRNNYTAFVELQDERELRFRVRNRQNYFGTKAGDGAMQLSAYGGGECIGGPYHSHNFSLYVPGEKYFAEHPEYFALQENGKRLPATSSGSGNICLTHPQVRKIALASLLDFIAADRKEFPRGRPASPDLPPPIIYDVSQPDNPVVCHCPSCRALVQREGSESGPLIDFINELADGVRERYPEIKLQTFAYQWSHIPPRTLRPRENVVLRWCDWSIVKGGTWSYPEPWFPLSAPINANRAENLRQWSAITPAGLHIWDYGQPFAWSDFPFTLVPMLADDFRLFADNHVFGVFLQNNGVVPWFPGAPSGVAGAVGHFSPLYNWLACQLMLDPRKPVEPLIDTFMNNYYGPAAPTMRVLYDKLAAAQRTLPPRENKYTCVSEVDYATAAFYAEIDALLQKAEAACEPNSRALLHVQFERLRSDSALLQSWRKLEWKLVPGVTMPFDRDAVITRIEARGRPVMLNLGIPESLINGLAAHIKRWRGSLVVAELPERFRSLPPDRVMQFLYPTFNLAGNDIVVDSEAAGGKALRLHSTDAESHDQAPRFGLYDQTLKMYGPMLNIAKADIPQDGKFHLYKVGRWRILPGTRLYGHKSWLVSCHAIEDAYTPPDPGLDANPSANEWDVWVSAKFTGPAYVRDSQEVKNGFYMDRVVLVKP